MTDSSGYDDVDVDEVVEQVQLLADNDDFLHDFLREYDESTLRDFISEKQNGKSHRAAAVSVGLMESEGVMLGPPVEAVVFDRDNVRYGGFDKEKELQNAELPPDREPRDED